MRKSFRKFYIVVGKLKKTFDLQNDHDDLP